MAETDGKTMLAATAAHDLAARALAAAGTAEPAAAATAAALVKAELDGLASHGLSRVPAYADQVASGKVAGRAVPALDWVRPGLARVDASCGLAYPALEMARAALVERTPAQGIAAAGIASSHHFGVAGHAVEPLAEAGLIAIALGNTPAAMAPWGGRKPVFGTNPLAFAWPRPGRPPLVIDLSMSKVARGRIMLAKRRGEAIPEGWAIDAEGRPTTDPGAALGGAMVPLGDAKGAALALMIELLAAALTGSAFGPEASSFFDAEGPPPRVGQLLLAIAADALDGSALARGEALFEMLLAQPGVRLPGDRRLEARQKAAREGIAVDTALVEELQRRGESAAA